jgi:exodeoxyribonuclease-3
MRIFSWNVNGLRAVINRGDFATFVKTYQPDIMCLQETKARPGQAEIDLPDYEEFWHSADRAGYSGTAIFTRVKPLNVRLDFASSGLTDRYGDLGREGRVIAMEFEQFWLVNVYTPNAKNDLSRLEIRQAWDAAFLQYIQELERTKPVLFCGDLNVAHREIDLARPRTHVGKHGFTLEERADFQHYLDVGLVDVFRELHGDLPEQYTWWSYLARSRERNVGWRLDYFVASASLMSHVTAADIHPEQQGSDHCPISLTLDF